MELRITDRTATWKGGELKRTRETNEAWVMRIWTDAPAPSEVYAPTKFHRLCRLYFRGVTVRARAPGAGRPPREGPHAPLHVDVAVPVLEGYRGRAEANGTSMRAEVEAAFWATEKRQKKNKDVG